jgi:transposase
MGRGKRDKIYLSAEQRERLEAISRNGQAPVKKVVHAQVLLMSDEGELATKRWTDDDIASALNLHRNSVGRIRHRFLRQGEAPALNRQVRKTPPVPPKVDGHLEAQIIALCCSDPPDGRAHWSIRLLTSELKARQIVTEISRETVRQTLKKTNSDLGKRNASASRNGT